MMHGNGSSETGIHNMERLKVLRRSQGSSFSEDDR